MPVTQKPTRAAPADAPDVDSLINRGGRVASEPRAAARSKPEAVINLRMTAGVRDRIDAALTGVARPDGKPISRHTWILTAIAEKLAREGGSGRAAPAALDTDELRQAYELGQENECYSRAGVGPDEAPPSFDEWVAQRDAPATGKPGVLIHGKRRQARGQSVATPPAAEPVIYTVRSPEDGAA